MYTKIPLDTSKNKKVVFITGAAQGIGAEIAQCFLEKGYFVAFADFNEQAGREQEKKYGGNAKFYHYDLSDENQVTTLAQTLQRDFEIIDVIIHNAKSPAREKDVLKNLQTEWDSSLHVMLKHPLLLNHLLLEHLKKSSNPSILFIGSTNAQFISQQPLSYHTVKGALSQAIRYLACEYGAHKIRVNLLHPGIVDVPGRTRKNPQLFQKTVECVIPLQRTALAKEVGETCVFFASEEAKYLTGAALNLDGGEHLKDHFHLAMTQFMNEEQVVR